jgi:hypothetical protein
MRRAGGLIEPAIYCSASVWSQVQQAFHDANEPDPLYWIASYSSPPDSSIPPGAIAHQYADPSASGGHFDLSSVQDYWPGVDPAPPEPTTTEDDDVSLVLIRCPDLGGAAVLVESTNGANMVLESIQYMPPNIPQVTASQQYLDQFLHEAGGEQKP